MVTMHTKVPCANTTNQIDKWIKKKQPHEQMHGYIKLAY